MKTKRRRSGEADTAWDGRRARVLVVDSNTELRNHIEGALRQDGHEVIGAVDAEEFLDQLGTLFMNREHADLVVTVLRPQVLGGLDLLTLLQDTAWRIPILALTPEGDAAARLRAHRLGATATLDESVGEVELRAAARALLRAARR